MTNPERHALSKILDAAGAQLDLLADATHRPEVDRARLSQSCLDFLLEAIAVQAENLAEAKLPPDVRAAAQAFAERERDLRARSIDVRHHLIELGEGWMCGQCKTDVVSGAVISGVRKKRIKLELRCKACGSTAPIKKQGRAAFDKRFGHLLADDWNPEANGFIWNEG